MRTADRIARRRARERAMLARPTLHGLEDALAVCAGVLLALAVVWSLT